MIDWPPRHDSPACMTKQTRFSATASKIRRELLKSLSKNLRITSAGTRFEGLDVRVPLVYGLGADHLSRTGRPWTYRLFAGLVDSRPGSLVDIGANVGLYLIWLKSVDRDRQYIGFEPNPACYFYLQELIRCNRFSDASAFPLALSDTRALRTFYARRLGDKMGSLLAHHRVEKDKPYSFNVITEPGDPVFEDLDLAAISAIKIDVEGFEVEVLRGLAKTLSRYRPVVICEVLSPDRDHPEFDARMGRIGELLSVTRDLDYRVLSLDADEQLRVARSSQDLVGNWQPDRILVPADDLDRTLELWKQVRTADS